MPKNDRAELVDYERSGYDCGHMAPNADFSTRKRQTESFFLANMVPQVHENNAGAYLVTNDDTRTYSVVSVSQLEKMIGLSLLPGLPQHVRDAGMLLSKPDSRQGRKRMVRPDDEFTLRDFTSLVIEAINRASKKQGVP